jgi:hypothetical protein
MFNDFGCSRTIDRGVFERSGSQALQEREARAEKDYEAIERGFSAL